MATRKIKDPDAVLDYDWDWATWLGSDTITSSTMTAEAGITLDSSSNTTTLATATLSGGTAGKQYEVTNRVVTAGGRTEDRTLIVYIRER